MGFGPAGMFCGLMLARAGYRPLILERGLDADSRAKAVARYWTDGTLDPECNVQFGEAVPVRFQMEAEYAGQGSVWAE